MTLKIALAVATLEIEFVGFDQLRLKYVTKSILRMIGVLTIGLWVWSCSAQKSYLQVCSASNSRGTMVFTVHIYIFTGAV